MTTPPGQYPYQQPPGEVPGGPADRPLPSAYDPDPVPMAAGSASLGANLLGAVLGLAGTVLGVSLVIAGSGLIREHLRTFSSGVDGGGLTLLVLGVAVLGAVVVGGAWAPATPVLGGLLVSFVGVVGLVSNDFVDTLTDQLPSEADGGDLYSWISLGAMLMLGLMLLAAGLACSLARRRRPRHVA